MANQTFSGFVYDLAGAAVADAVVNLYDRNSTSPSRADTTTNSSGYWTISHATEGRFDVQITNGTSKIRRKYDDEIQLLTLEVANFHVRNPADTYDYNIVPLAIAADRTLNLPLLTGTDTLMAEAHAATLTNKTYNASGTGNILTNVGASEIEIGIITGHTELAAGPAETDELLISDAGTFKRINANELLNPENFTAVTLPAAADEVFISDGGVGKKITHDDLLFGANGTPSTQALGDSAAIGTALDATRSDHKHAMPAAAVASDVDTGTDTVKALTADALAGSNMGEKVVQIRVFDVAIDTATGDRKATFVVPSSMHLMNLVEVHGEVDTAGTTNTLDVQLRNVTQTADMLSTKLTIDTGETGSDTAATGYVINASEDDLATYDVIAVDVDAVHSTAAKGLVVTMIFRLP
jgi:hypothetical protein